jgi:hypothetical protein
MFEPVMEPPPPPQAASTIASAGATSQRDAPHSRVDRFNRIWNDMMASLMQWDAYLNAGRAAPFTREPSAAGDSARKAAFSRAKRPIQPAGEGLAIALR